MTQSDVSASTGGPETTTPTRSSRAERNAATGADLDRSRGSFAAALFISEATVKTHLLHAFAKLGVDDRTATVVAALERGIIALPRRPP